MQLARGLPPGDLDPLETGHNFPGSPNHCLEFSRNFLLLASVLWSVISNSSNPGDL